MGKCAVGDSAVGGGGGVKRPASNEGVAAVSYAWARLWWVGLKMEDRAAGGYSAVGCAIGQCTASGFVLPTLLDIGGN